VFFFFCEKGEWFEFYAQVALVAVVLVEMSVFFYDVVTQWNYKKFVE